MKLRILPYKLPRIFILDSKDEFYYCKTPIGDIPVVCFENRVDFKKLVGIIKYDGDEQAVPDSMGAMTVWGLFNNEKQMKETLIILSKGSYSNLDYKQTGYTNEEWLKISRVIREYHEFAHVVSRALYPANQESFRDEIIADSIGLLQATGRYDKNLAKAFLGIERDVYRQGGRLENYLNEGDTINSLAITLSNKIEEMAQFLMSRRGFWGDILIEIEENLVIMSK